MTDNGIEKDTFRYESYVEYEDLIGHEYIITYGCFIATIADDRTGNYMDCSYTSEDKLFNVETTDGKNFNVIVPCDAFDFENYDKNLIRSKEQKDSEEKDKEIAELESQWRSSQ
jgi:hypothetical protein